MMGGGLAAHLHGRLASRQNREPSFVDAPEREHEEEDAPEEQAHGAARRNGALRVVSCRVRDGGRVVFPSGATLNLTKISSNLEPSVHSANTTPLSDSFRSVHCLPDGYPCYLPIRARTLSPLMLIFHRKAARGLPVTVQNDGFGLASVNFLPQPFSTNPL